MSADRVFTFEEISEKVNKEDLHLLIAGKVYDVHKFLDEHPGGDEVLLGEAGRDATEAFEDVGHSDEARELMEQYYVGTCPEGAPTKNPIGDAKAALNGPGHPASGFSYLIPIALLAAYLAYRFAYLS